MLALKGNPGAGEAQFILQGERMDIGRDQSNNLVLEDLSVSGFHATLFLDGGVVSILDLGSKNGTYVNGARVQGRTPVNTWEKVRIGNVEFELIDTERRAPTRIMPSVAPERAPSYHPTYTARQFRPGDTVQRPMDSNEAVGTHVQRDVAGPAYTAPGHGRSAFRAGQQPFQQGRASAIHHHPVPETSGLVRFLFSNYTSFLPGIALLLVSMLAVYLLFFMSLGSSMLFRGVSPSWVWSLMVLLGLLGSIACSFGFASLMHVADVILRGAPLHDWNHGLQRGLPLFGSSLVLLFIAVLPPALLGLVFLLFLKMATGGSYLAESPAIIATMILFIGWSAFVILRLWPALPQTVLGPFSSVFQNAWGMTARQGAMSCCSWPILGWSAILLGLPWLLHGLLFSITPFHSANRSEVLLGLSAGIIIDVFVLLFSLPLIALLLVVKFHQATRLK